MGYKTVFERSELKYIVNAQQLNAVKSAFSDRMYPDQYGKTVIRNLYFDTDTYELIRRSIERPDFKEKFRVRSYALPDDDTKVFAELKMKYKGVVYKRRTFLTHLQYVNWLINGQSPPKTDQIIREIDYFFKRCGSLKPRVFLCYEREAFFGENDLRITFDSNITARTFDLVLDGDINGEKLLENGYTLMEIKSGGAMPLWLVKVLSENKIYKTSFSKYGMVYKTMIFNKEEKTNV